MENPDKAIVLRENYINPKVWKQFSAMAVTFFKSGAYPSYIKNAPQLMVVFQAGFEMGMKPQESLKSLYIINGVVNVYGAALIRRLREHGWRVRYTDKKDISCTANVYKGDEKYTDTYSFEEAKESGYVLDSQGRIKVGWRKGLNRELKLRYGVISKIVKTYIPEVLGSAVDVVEVFEDYPRNEMDQESDGKFEKGKVIETETTETISNTNEEESLKDRLTKKSEPPRSSDRLRKKFFAVAKDYGLSPSDAKDLIKKKYKAQSFKDLAPEQITESIQSLEKKLANPNKNK